MKEADVLKIDYSGASEAINSPLTTSGSYRVMAMLMVTSSTSGSDEMLQTMKPPQYPLPPLMSVFNRLSTKNPSVMVEKCVMLSCLLFFLYSSLFLLCKGLIQK